MNKSKKYERKTLAYIPKSLKELGFNKNCYLNSEGARTWECNSVISVFIYSLLLEFRKDVEEDIFAPSDFKKEKDWHCAIDDMIYAFEYESVNWKKQKEYDIERVNRGWNLFIKYYHNLWI